MGYKYLKGTADYYMGYQHKDFDAGDLNNNFGAF